MFPQTAMQDIRISGSAECAVDIKDHRLFTDMGRKVTASRKMRTMSTATMNTAGWRRRRTASRKG
ncbi:hypothetical protein VEGS09_35490 [Escherichia coli]|nr:hypothetical protein VEGS09_35490 [Escherichia coli]BEC11364.1 hypothetical protein VEE66_35340 [Escherichia coli]